MVTGTPLTRYAWLSVAAAVVTFGLKMWAWRLTGSVGLLSDALESLVNLAAGFIAVASLTVSARPADDDHAYGHTKAEYFAGGIEGLLILVAAAGIGWNAINRLVAPEPLDAPGLGIAVSAVAAAINLGVARVLSRVGRRHSSVALVADARHLMTDVWTTVAVIGAVALVASTGWLWLDPLLGLMLAFHIIMTGLKLMSEAAHGLMDAGLPPEEMRLVEEVLGRFGAEGVAHHALRTRQAGARRFMSVHLLVPGDWTVDRAHGKAEEIEHALRDAVPRLTVLTHLEPIDDPASWQDVGLDRPAP